MYMADRQDNVYRGEIDHASWELRDAQAIIHRNTMTDWLGIDLPDQAPLCHFASKTKVVAWGRQPIAKR